VAHRHHQDQNRNQYAPPDIHRSTPAPILRPTAKTPTVET
jgi:hypothetical protein